MPRGSYTAAVEAHPPLDALRAVVGRLRAAALSPVLGGSGLLFAHGLVERVGDWDLLVDADPARVRAALGTHDEPTRAGGRFATAAKFTLDERGAAIDVLVRFALLAGEPPRAVHLPALGTGEWEGIPLGSLTVWMVAYYLLGRDARAEVVAAHLRAVGVDPDHRARMLTEPLPAALRAELESLPVASSNPSSTLSSTLGPLARDQIRAPTRVADPKPARRSARRHPDQPSGDSDAASETS